jgi:hypothetical protein
MIILAIKSMDLAVYSLNTGAISKNTAQIQSNIGPLTLLGFKYSVKLSIIYNTSSQTSWSWYSKRQRNMDMTWFWYIWTSTLCFIWKRTDTIALAKLSRFNGPISVSAVTANLMIGNILYWQYSCEKEITFSSKSWKVHGLNKHIVEECISFYVWMHQIMMW